MNYIQNLGENIIRGGYIKASDYVDILNSLKSELIRRSRPYEYYDFTAPIPGTHIDSKMTLKCLNIAEALGFNNQTTIGSIQIIKKTDLEKMILFLREKMLENV